MIVMEEQNGKVRYRLLDTVRHYGREKLLESGEAAIVLGIEIGTWGWPSGQSRNRPNRNNRVRPCLPARRIAPRGCLVGRR